MRMPLRAAAALALACATAAAYDRAAAVENARNHYNAPQHDCSTAYDACSPWSYWGDEDCGYQAHGGDCANFLSQNLLAGGHPDLTEAPCRGYPCGREEVGAAQLGACLAANYGWTSRCVSSSDPPPAGLQPGDALIFHGSSCTDANEVHATLIVDVRPGRVGVAAHSNAVFNASIDGYASEFGWYDFLLYPGSPSPPGPPGPGPGPGPNPGPGPGPGPKPSPPGPGPTPG